jgi:tRNA pseudouridine55 synthase
VEELIPSFSGTILQQPPMYSALKYRGERLYRLARAGIEVERPQREVEVFRIELIDWRPPCFSIEVNCGQGTYIRSLAHDMGQALGCGAHIKGLTRTSCGPFDIAGSMTLDRVEDAFRNGDWQSLLLPMDSVLQHLPAVILSEADESSIGNGRPIALDRDVDQSYCRAYSSAGHLIAVLRFLPDKGLWQPEKVFSKRQ